jgi:hypothetical protein
MVIVEADEHRLLFGTEGGERGSNREQVARGPLGCVGKGKQRDVSSAGWGGCGGEGHQRNVAKISRAKNSRRIAR